LHWIELDTGQLAARVRIGRDPIRAHPGEDTDGTLYAVTVDGALAAFRVAAPCGRPVLPLGALVGRPNGGRSTLLNSLTRSPDGLVADQPGLTRDRHYGICRLGAEPFLVVDTGGLGGDDEGVAGLTARQAEGAIAEATVVVFVVDARDGVVGQDR